MAVRPRAFSLNYGHPLANGLVFAGLGQGPTHSTFYQDSSLYRNHGTLTSMNPATDWVWDSLLGRWACDLDGDEDRIKLAPTPAMNNLAGITISAWVKFRTIDYGTDQVVWIPASDDATMAYVLGTNANNNAMQFAGQPNQFTRGTIVLTTDVWTHLLGTMTAGAIHVYNNGVLNDGVKNASPVMTPECGSAIIGYNAYWRGEVDGRIADVGIWRRVLCASEISILADPSNAMLGGLIQTPKRRYFRMAAAGGHILVPNTMTGGTGVPAMSGGTR